MMKGKIHTAIQHTKNRKKKITDCFRKYFKECKELRGVTVIELVLILVIIIALLLIFKSQLIDLINTIFDKIISESSGI